MAEETKKIRIEVKGFFTKSQLSDFPKFGETIEGKVIESGSKFIILDLGNFGIGRIPKEEWAESFLDLKELKIGDVVFVKIKDSKNDDGFLELSLKEAGKDLAWLKLQEKMKNKEMIEVKISKANQGGLMAEIFGITAFLPVSQLSAEHYPRVEGGDKTRILQELQKFVGKNLLVQIIDLDIQEQKLIISERAELEEKLKEILKKYKVGDIVEGEIGGIVNFGAFLKFPLENPAEEKLEGLIHISELDHKLIENPADIVRVGQIVKAKIIDISKGQISLSLKALKENPWSKAKEKYKKGDIILGKVTKFNPFGAFVELPDGLQGLLHISEFGSERKMKESIEIGKTYNLKVLLVNPEEHKIALGLIEPPSPNF